MEISDRINQLEDELNLLKSEVKTLLVDLREDILIHSSPFTPQMAASAQTIRPEPIVEQKESPAERPPSELSEHSSDGGQLLETPPALEPSAPEPVRVPQPVATATAADPIPAPMSAPPMENPLPPKRPEEAAPALPSDRNWDRFDIAGLCKWADSAARRIGTNRLKESLDVYELLNGPYPAGTKEAVSRVADLCVGNSEPNQVSMNDIVLVLTQLDALLHRNSQTDLTMLSLLSDAA